MPKIIELWMPPEERSIVMTDETGRQIFICGLTSDEVYCDICNADITIRPVPVVETYALCLKCLAEIEPGWKKQIPKDVLACWQRE